MIENRKRDWFGIIVGTCACVALLSLSAAAVALVVMILEMK